jgi:hypothetical protein
VYIYMCMCVSVVRAGGGHLPSSLVQKQGGYVCDFMDILINNIYMCV